VSEHLVLRLDVDLAPADRGGRRGPVTDGYRASLSVGQRRRGVEPVVHDAVLVLEEAEELAPGGRAVARAWVVSPDELPGSIGEGAVVTLLERDRIVGRARVLELLVDDSARPLLDLRAARGRALRPAG
jgi:hypothetical protein